MNCYLVWYRVKGDAVDRIRGVSMNYKRAEAMAKSLKLYLKAVEKASEVEVGVKRGEHGRLYEDESLSLRWAVE